MLRMMAVLTYLTILTILTLLTELTFVIVIDTAIDFYADDIRDTYEFALYVP